MICVSFICYFAQGVIFVCLDVNPHPLASRILLLWFAPLAYMIPWELRSALFFGPLILLSYIVFYLSNLRSACLIPVALLFTATALKMVRLKYLVKIVIPLIVIVAFFFHHLPAINLGLESAYYRAENYFFSFHIATKHPLLGIGLTAPRNEFLNEYKIRYPYVTKEDFAGSVKRIRTSENVFLSFLAEVGFPFTIIYIFALVVLLTRLIRQLVKDGGDTLFHPIVLLMPILAGVLNFQVLDGLYHPQVSWFFHILLGLIPWDKRPS